MKVFIYKISALLIVSFAIIALFIKPMMSKEVDNYYVKLNIEKTNSLIIGSSRASQGLNPIYLGFENMKNFAFTNMNSPYGEIYSKAIKRKYKGPGGTIIFEVNPFVFASDKNIFPREKDKTLDLFFAGTIIENPAYIIQKSPKPLYRHLLQTSSRIKVHKNGWMEVLYTQDSANRMKSTQKKIKSYEILAEEYVLDEYRVTEFKKILKFCKKNDANILILRLPVASEIKEIEDANYPEFNDLMKDISDQFDCPYLDYSDLEYEFNDGVHLTRESAINLSINLKPYLRLK